MDLRRCESTKPRRVEIGPKLQATAMLAKCLGWATGTCLTNARLPEAEAVPGSGHCREWLERLE